MEITLDQAWKRPNTSALSSNTLEAFGPRAMLGKEADSLSERVGDGVVFLCVIAAKVTIALFLV